MSALAILPLVQARAEFVPVLKRIQAEREAATDAAAAVEQHELVRPPERPVPRPQLAFYRKYTEAILRRYLRMSLSVGRVPSVLGRGELFRAKVSSYRMECFEDLVIFCHDVERSLQRLKADQQFLIEEIAIKQFTVPEMATRLRMHPRSVLRQYARAVDRLTRILLEVGILKVAPCKQAPPLAKQVGNAP